MNDENGMCSEPCLARPHQLANLVPCGASLARTASTLALRQLQLCHYLQCLQRLGRGLTRDLAAGKLVFNRTALPGNPSADQRAHSGQVARWIVAAVTPIEKKR